MIGRRQSAVARVAELLETQRGALLAGDLGALEGMEAGLARAMDRLRRDRATAAELARLQDMAARNSGLIRAAQAGVAQARAHLATARAPALTTYDARGRCRPDAPAPSRLLSRG